MDTLTLTVNSRLALNIKREYDKAQQQNGLKSWRTPAVMPLTQWIEKTWQSLLPKQRLLTSLQQQQLWQRIIAQQLDSDSIETNNTATQIMQAWQMIRGWEINLNSFKDHNEETALLYRCMTQFETLCQDKNWITGPALVDELLNHQQAWVDKLPSHITLSGFDSLPKRTQQLIDLFAEHSTLNIIHMNQPAKQIRRVCCNDVQHEIKSMATWAKQCWQNNPNATIACIVPALNLTRNYIEDIFYQTFYQQIKNTPEKQYYNLSAGQALTEFSVIADALIALRLLEGKFHIDDLSTLLQSPYFSLDLSDPDMGALVDREIRELNEPVLNNSALFIALHTAQAIYPANTWSDRWHQLCQFSKKQPPLATVSKWIEQFCMLLELLGWPGKRGLNSIEYQVLQRWRNALADIAQLDCVTQPMPLASALNLLQHSIQQTVFQPEGSQANVQILGVLESANIQFNCMWIMGLESQSWPPSPQPNPFIPYSVQVAHELPHCSAAHEYAYCKKTLARLFNSAQQVIVSSPQQDGDSVLNPSALISDIPLQLLAQPEMQQYGPEVRLESIQDNTLLRRDQSTMLKGGSELIKLQALCPFRAQSSMHLKSRPLNQPDVDLASYEKGNLVHLALHKIWLTLNNQATLNALEPAECDALIERTIDASISEQQKPITTTTQQYFLNTEKKRLKQLLTRWLDFEKQRPPFDVIEREHSHHLTINGISIHCKIDRIDRCQDGIYVIDYKTGAQTITRWFGERPTEPQLPLYSSFIDGIDGACYAEVRNQGMSFKGVCNESSNQHFSALLPIDQIKHPDSIDSWQAQKNHWKQTIEKLLHDFYQGDANVDPVDRQISCQYCELQPFCRIEHEQ
jgi:ATP-dependent helicase/nuclease subunit B